MIEPSGSGTARDQAPGREFWLVIGYAAILGVVRAVGGLVFLAVIGVGPTWYGDDAGTGWMQGQLWWVAVAAAAGLLVGVLRRLFAMPAHLPGLIDDLETGQMDTAMVPKTIAVSAVSLIGGASLGPEVALGSIGGGTGSWIAKRRKLASEDGQALTLRGMAGSYSGLFSSPLLSMMLVLEVARPPRAHYAETFYGTLMSSAVGFGLYFALAGSVFLGIYDVPKYTFESWHLLGHAARDRAAPARRDRIRPPRRRAATDSLHRQRSTVHRACGHRHAEHLAAAGHAPGQDGRIRREFGHPVHRRTDLPDPVQTAPILLAVGTSFLVLSGLELILARRRQPGGQVAPSP